MRRFQIGFYSPPNLLLCKNKDSLPGSNPGVSKVEYTCGISKVGDTKKKARKFSLEHQTDSMACRWVRGESQSTFVVRLIVSILPPYRDSRNVTAGRLIFLDTARED